MIKLKIELSIKLTYIFKSKYFPRHEIHKKFITYY